MSLDLAALVGKTAITVVPYMGENITITYDPTYITPQTLAAMQAGDDEAFKEFFLKLVKTWDITSGAEKWPLDADHVELTPLRILRAIYQSIIDAPTDREAGKA